MPSFQSINHFFANNDFSSFDEKRFHIANPNPFSMAMMIKIIKVQLEQNVRCQKGKRTGGEEQSGVARFVEKEKSAKLANFEKISLIFLMTEGRRAEVF